MKGRLHDVHGKRWSKQYQTEVVAERVPVLNWGVIANKTEPDTNWLRTSSPEGSDIEVPLITMQHEDKAKSYDYLENGGQDWSVFFCGNQKVKRQTRIDKHTECFKWACHDRTRSRKPRRVWPYYRPHASVTYHAQENPTWAINSRRHCGALSAPKPRSDRTDRDY